MVIYSIARLVIGAACSGVYLCAYVLALEFVGPGKRTIPGLAYHAFSVIGISLLAPIGYFVKDFRTISWILAIPTLLFLPFYFIITESVQTPFFRRVQASVPKFDPLNDFFNRRA